ncbi:arginine/ornithine antiporter [Weissella oryzae SG25]|uniref:Arginine/ornithine antiporter n=1 Tax=Weissella oryzae (strain DSM 25784 / JCM 18191 / LMG 30913 / SG25) TaxID=1329250 RepID=A0A069CRD6_WEIOS|nr:basic amino acid/polyamine antiporter [Weissella oryzae]GAK30280.1 arginine/ornithine antiporter [Weissella oryzae SG25]
MDTNNATDLTKPNKGIALPALIAVVISTSIGSGIYDLPATLAQNATPGGALVAWLITGFGILMLGLGMNYLAVNKLELNGITDYARAGFGDFAGFISGWGYWLSNWLANVAFATMLMSTLGFFFPAMKAGNTVFDIFVASVISWLIAWLVCRGIEEAAVVNLIVTVCKLIPLFAFFVVTLMSFKAGVFTAHFWSNMSVNLQATTLSFSHATFGGILKQIQGSLMTMMWVFIGFEGATMLSSRARRKSDAGKATMIGLVTLIIIYIVISMLPYGYLSQAQLVKVPHPALVYLFERMVGPVGGAFISVGLIISILGAWLSLTLLTAETTKLMAEQKVLPAWFGKINRFGVASTGVWLTQGFIQIFLVSLIFTSQAYNFAYSLCTSVMLICYALVGAYLVKEGYQKRSAGLLIVGTIASAFEIMSVLFAGLVFLWLTSIVYIIGFIFYYFARKQNNKKIAPYEWILMIIITLFALGAILALLAGKIAI